MADIEVTITETAEGWQGQVLVQEAGSTSNHTVTISHEYFTELTNGKYTPEDLLRASFEFLLKREPKEAILSAFDLPTISRYFQEYEHTVVKLLG